MNDICYKHKQIIIIKKIITPLAARITSTKINKYIIMMRYTT